MAGVPSARAPAGLAPKERAGVAAGTRERLVGAAIGSYISEDREGGR